MVIADVPSSSLNARLDEWDGKEYLSFKTIMRHKNKTI